MAVRKRGNGYQADFMLAGTRYREHFNTEHEAKAWEALARAAHAAQREVPPAHTVGATKRNTAIATIRDLVRHTDARHWSGNPNKRAGPELARNAYLFAKWVGPLTSIEEALSESVIERYLRYRETELRNSGSTVNRHLASISKLAAEAVRLEKLPRKPEMRKRPEGEARDRVFSENEESLILAVVEAWGFEDHRDLFIWLADTGCRLGETEKMPWSAFGEGGVVSIPKNITKSGKGRVIVLTRRAQEAIARLRQKYSHLTGPFAWHHRRTTRTLWERLRGHIAWMNEHTVIHTFRHTCASRIVKETGNLYQCQRWLGHSDPKMTMRYAKYAPKDMAELARLLEQRQERTALDERQRAA